MNAHIAAIEYSLPEGVLTNADLNQDFPDWSVEKISSKTGIDSRHIAMEGEYSSDLAVRAARKLLHEAVIDPMSIDYVLLCTQSPDFYMPITAAMVQHQLGLRIDIGATDINLGCSGYVYGLGLAKGLVETGMARNVLLITVDTYSRFINQADRSVRTLFGDGASATSVAAAAGDEMLYAFTYGTDGSGGHALMVPNGGLRPGAALSEKASPSARGLESNGFDLYMDGPAIFNFSLDVVPKSVASILEKSNLEFDDVDLFVFHQANAYMLEHLRKKIGIDPEKFFISISQTGNTVSSTIPIALKEAVDQGVLVQGMKVMLVGFGVGLSWGGLMVNW